MNILNNFVVFEGGDGSGTTTQLKKIGEQFETRGISSPRLSATFEPTKGPIGSLVRQSLRGEISLKAETTAFLFAADRNEHVYGPGGIIEQCGKGELVICDRYALSSLAYQGITCDEELPMLLNRDFPKPELLFFFDLDPRAALDRVESRGQKEIYENIEFQIRVRERYKELLPIYDKDTRVEIIDASRSVEEVTREIWSALEKLPIFKG